MMTACKMYKTFLETLKIYNKGRTIACSWIGKLNIVKILLLKLIYKFSTISIRISRCLWNLTSQSQMFIEIQRAKNTQDILEEQEDGV